MSVQVTYGQKTLKFEPTDKISKLADKLTKKALAATQWQVNGNPIENQITMVATLQSLGVKEQDIIVIVPRQNQITPIKSPSQTAPNQGYMEAPVQAPIPIPSQSPSNPFDKQNSSNNISANLMSSKQNQSIPQAQLQQLFKIDPNVIPKFGQQEIIVPVRPVKSNKPNNKIPQMAQSKIYEYDVKILDQGCTIEISKPNDEFKATLLIENTTQEESLKIKFQPDEVHNEPQYTLRIGTRELGGTKVSFLRDGKGFGVLWHNGLQSKFKFWLDE